MSADPVYLQRLARYRQHLERQQRLGFPVKVKLHALAVTEAKARNGELKTPPKPIAQVPEITESDIRRTCDDLRQSLPDPRLSVTGRSERRGPMRRVTRGFDFI